MSQSDDADDGDGPMQFNDLPFVCRNRFGPLGRLDEAEALSPACYKAVAHAVYQAEAKEKAEVSVLSAPIFFKGQMRKQFHFNYFLSGDKLTYLHVHYPHLQVIPSRSGEVHPHPIMHLDQELAEEQAIGYINRVCPRMGPVVAGQPVHDGRRRICDIGGNPVRHQANRRGYIHSCNPVLSSRDVFRNLKYERFTRGDNPASCGHLGQTCDCHEFDCYLSVNSLYYLEPSDVVKCLQRSKRNLLVAVVHAFDSTFGSFAGGEATYQFDTPTTVVMNVAGNLASFSHANLHWLRLGGLPIYRKEGHAIAISDIVPPDRKSVV